MLLRVRLRLESVGPACAGMLMLACVCSAAPPQPPAPQRLAQAPPQPALTQQGDAAVDPDAAALVALMQRYFDALNGRDAQAAIGLWADGSDGRRFAQFSLPRMLETSSPTWTNLRVSQVAVDGKTARARVEFDLAIQAAQPAQPAQAAPNATPPVAAPPPVPRPPRHVTNIATFVRDEAGGWRIDSEISESQDIANRLVAARDETALNRLLAAEADRIDFAVLQALFGLGGEANMRSQFDAGIRASSLALRLTEEKKVTLAGTAQEALAESYMVHGLTDLGFAYAYRPSPDFAKAIDYLTRALDIQTRNKDEGGQGNTLQSRGNAYYASGDYSRALDDYQRALTLQTAQGNVDGAARSRLGIGNVQFLFGQFDLSMEAYQLAQKAFEEIESVEPQPRALQGLARVYAALGDFSRARDLYTRALTLLVAADRRAEQAGTLRDIGDTCFQQGKLDDAEANVNKALAIDTQLKDATGQGRALFALGLLQVVRGRYDEAIQLYTRAAESFTRASFRDGLGQAILARAAAKFERRDLPGALQDYTDSARTFDAAGNREGVARANVGLAMLYVLQRESALALAAAEKASQMADQAGAPEIGWQARYESGRALALAGESDRARQRFEDSIAMLERSQFEAGGDVDTASPSRRAAPYAALVEWYVAHGDSTRALELADAAKRRSLQDLVLPYRFRLSRGLTTEQQREERRLFSQRISLAKQLRRERQRPASDAARVAQLETQLEAARTAAAEWQRALLRDHFETAFQRGDASFNSIADLERLGQKLNEASALVHFVVGDEQTTVIVATLKAAPADSAARAMVEIRSYPVAVTRADLAGQVFHFADAIERRLDTIVVEGRTLYERLFGPAREQLAGRTQLVIVPDDSLWALPFEALRRGDAAGDVPGSAGTGINTGAGDRYLFEQGVSVSLEPSIAAFMFQPPSPAAADAPTLFAGGRISDVTPMQSTLTLLPASAPAPADASAASTAASAPTSLAAWELFEHPLQAGSLRLLDREPAEEQIRLTQGRLGAMGLAWALRIAGVPRVTIARWPLDADERARAVRQAQTSSISETEVKPQPHEWAAWMTIGPPAPPAAVELPPPAPPRP